MKDHRSLARDMNLFHFEEHSPGMVFWHPNGFKLFHAIENYMRYQHIKYGYNEIRTPLMLNKTLWEQSGHWDKFGENIFVVPTEDEDKQTYAIKPMSCPAHIGVYNGSGIKSYKDLPARYNEMGICHRNEPSGALNGCMRLRQFTQDDAHIFCTEEQILGETKNYIEMLRETYSHFGFDKFDIKFATRPNKRIGSDEVWDKSEEALASACKELGIEYEVSPGEGAFYGPKLEFTLQDSLGRDWQCGTIQVDFNLTGRLDAAYTDATGAKKEPVLIHHAVLGSFERWIGILLEHKNGYLDGDYAPKYCVVTGITNDFDDYVQDIVNNDLPDAFPDLRYEKIGKKIKQYTKQRVPYLVIVGKKEQEKQTVTVREQATGNQDSMPRGELLSYLMSKGK